MVSAIRVPRRLRGYLFATLVVFVSWAIRRLLDPVLGTSLPFALPFVAVVCSSLIGGSGAGVLAAVLGVAISWFFWMGPEHAFRFDTAGLVSYLVFMLVCATMIATIRRRKLAEDMLAAELDRFTTTFQSIGDAVIAVDLDDRITFINSRACEFVGRGPANLLSRRFPDVVRLLDRPSGEPILSIAGGVTDGSPTSLTKDGILIRDGGTQLTVSDRAAPIRNFGGRLIGAVLTLTDISSVKELERERQLSDARKNEFFSVLAHELRNPLSPLQSALTTIQSRPFNEERARSAMEIMQRQLDQLVRLVDDLTDVGRIQAGSLKLELHVIPLSEVVRAAVEAVSPHILTRHQNLLQASAPEFFVRGDRARMTQMLTNLLNNASRFSRPGAPIELEVRQQGPEIHISITDHGVGLASGEISNLFELFSRVEPDKWFVDGLGVGLAIAKRVAILHGGRISVTSEGKGAGSTFTVILPLEDGIEPATAAAEVQRAARRIQKVLVIDDNQDGATALAEMLRLLKFTVSVGNSGVEAIDLMESFAPDAAFLDLGLPDIPGLEVARRLRATRSADSMTLVALTGWGAPQDVDDALAAGFNAHVTKPISVLQIVELLGDPSA